jgi:hypothetical protein
MVDIPFAVPRSMPSPFADRSRLLHYYYGILTCALCRSLHRPSVLPPLVFSVFLSMKLPRSCSSLSAQHSVAQFSLPSLCIFVHTLRPQRLSFRSLSPTTHPHTPRSPRRRGPLARRVWPILRAPSRHANGGRRTTSPTRQRLSRYRRLNGSDTISLARWFTHVYRRRHPA